MPPTTSRFLRPRLTFSLRLAARRTGPGVRPRPSRPAGPSASPNPFPGRAAPTTSSSGSSRCRRLHSSCTLAAAAAAAATTPAAAATCATARPCRRLGRMTLARRLRTAATAAAGPALVCTFALAAALAATAVAVGVVVTAAAGAASVPLLVVAEQAPHYFADGHMGLWGVGGRRLR